MLTAGLVSVVALIAACGANTNATPTPDILAQPVGHAVGAPQTL